MTNRRVFLSGILASAAAIFAGIVATDSDAGPRRRKKRRQKAKRKHNRKVHRRVRRRTRWRVVRGRRRLVVPLGIAIGWELAYDDHVVLVKEVHEHHIVVEHPDGTTENVDVHQEDTEENSEELEGSVIEEEEGDDEAQARDEG